MESTTWQRVARLSLIGLELLVGVGAVFGGAGLIADGMGMPAEWLDSTPFDSWLLPGVFLLAVVAVPMIAAAVAELADSSWAHAASLTAGTLQVAWILAQLAILQRYFFLQPVMLACGVAVAGLAWWTHRGRPPEHTRHAGGPGPTVLMVGRAAPVTATFARGVATPYR